MVFDHRNRIYGLPSCRHKNKNKNRTRETARELLYCVTLLSGAP